MIVLINATAAKYGGALTILNGFIESKERDKSNHYIVMSPIEPKKKYKNVTWIKKETSGLATLLFTLFTSWFYCKFYKCEKIVSFSNINTLFPLKYKVSYFHNILIFEGKGVKYFILRNIIKYLGKKSSVYIVQTSYVKKIFIEALGYGYNIKICWPGISIHAPQSKASNSYINKIDDGKLKILVPITNIHLVHKNFELVQSLADFLAGNSIVLIVTADSNLKLSNINFIGMQSRDSYLALLDAVDATLITSTFETLCLPIFESLVKNKPVYVYDAPYVDGLFDDFGTIPGLIRFNNEESLKLKLSNFSKVDIDFEGDVYSPANWDF